MRYRFAREGVLTVIGNYLEPGSIKFDDTRKYPVTFSNNFNPDNIVGYANELRREEDGNLTAEIKWGPKIEGPLLDEINKSLFLTIYGNEVDSEGGYNPGETRLVRSVTLKSLFIMIHHGNPPHEDPWTEVERPADGDS